MNFDMPNWLTFVSSVVVSLVLVRYNEEIGGFFAKSREAKILKKRNKALRDYYELKKLRDNSVYREARLSNYQQIGNMLGFMTIIAAVLNTQFDASKLLDLFESPASANKADTVVLELMKFQDHPIIGFVFNIAAIVSMVILLVFHFKFSFTMNALAEFEEFEAKVKAQWPDAFLEQAKDDTKNLSFT